MTRARIIDAGATAREVDAIFRGDAAATAVVVEQPTGLSVVTRESLFSELTGPFGFGWSLHSNRSIGELAVGPALVLPWDMPIDSAAAAALARDEKTRYEDVAVRLDGGDLALLQVTPLFERLAEGFARRSTHDPLTGLGNRAMLADIAVPLLAAAEADGTLPVVVVIDLDRFKEVNDALGHDAGDQLLIRVGAALNEAAASYGTVVRLGGDEFAVLMADLGHLSQGGPATFHARLERLGGELMRQAQGPYLIGGIPITVEGSLGIAYAPEHGTDLATLLRRADGAMYAAKREHSKVAVWSEGNAATTSTELSMLADLRNSIYDDQLRLAFQPIVSAGTPDIVGVEALVRWQHPTLGLLQPGSFIALAERTGFIHEMTVWVLDEALRQLGIWNRAGLMVQMSVNISALSLVAGDLVKLVAERLAEHGVAAHMLTLEVTESAVMAQPFVAAQRLHTLRALGVRLSLDDFGTGYTSLALLRQLPFDELKLDQSFIAAAGAHGADAAIVHSVLELGHRMGLEVVAEGVEDEATRALLTGLGYDRLQGYHLGRPQGARETGRLLPGRTVLASAV